METDHLELRIRKTFGKCFEGQEKFVKGRNVFRDSKAERIKRKLNRKRVFF
jgi:hypothetical protein